MSSPSISGNTLSFQVSTTAGLTSLSYLGTLPQNSLSNYSPACSSLVASNPPCTPAPAGAITQGWWFQGYLKNGNGIASLSFHNIPVTNVEYPGGRAMSQFTDAETENDVVLLFPNPTDGVLNIQCANSVDLIEVLDGKGAVVFAKDAGHEKELKLDLSSLSPGIYSLSIHQVGRIIHKKLSIL